ncbi:YybH family protein [Cupriavidus necator]
MNVKRYRALLGVLVTFSLAMSSVGVRAADAGSEAIDKALRQQLRIIEQKWQSGDAKGLVDAAYTEQTSITGEGTPELYVGKAQLHTLVSGLLSEPSSAAITVKRTQVLNPNAAYTWVTWDVRPKNAGQKPFQMKSLFVWARTGAGWRIVADMYANGFIPQSR